MDAVVAADIKQKLSLSFDDAEKGKSDDLEETQANGKWNFEPPMTFWFPVADFLVH